MRTLPRQGSVFSFAHALPTPPTSVQADTARTQGIGWLWQNWQGSCPERRAVQMHQNPVNERYGDVTPPPF